MTISFSGLASGLDTSSWVESLVALKQAKIDTLEEEKETVLLSKETLDNIKSFFNSFRSVIEKVTDAQFGIASMDLFAQNLATSANLDVLTATATTEAEEATYNVLVDQLATNSAANSNYCYLTTIVQTTTATSDSKLINVGVKAGKIGVTVNGIERGIEITENDTIQTFIDKLKEIGVEASYNEKTGVFSIDIDAGAINDIDGTGIVDALHLQGVNEGYTSNSLNTSKTDTIYSAATVDTLMSELGAKEGVITIHANDADYQVTLTSTTTLGDFIADLKSHNIDVTLDSTGILTITDAKITDEGTTDILDALGLDLDIYSNTQVSGDLSHKATITQTTTATSDTLLKDLGDGINITDGQTVIIKNSSNEYTTITVGTTTTLGELLSDMTNAGVYAALNKDGTIEISGGTITGGTFDAISALKLTAEPYTAMTTGKPLTETVQKAELVTLETKLVDDLKVRAGYLEVTDADGNKFYEKIYHGQTLGDLMSDLGNLGIYTKLRDDGVLEITGGAFATLSDDRVQELIDNGTIRETDDRYKQGTDLLTCLYGAPVISTDQITVASTYSKTQALTHSVTNTIRATLTTTLENLGLTSDSNAVFTVRGENRTINVTKSMTVEDLMNALQNAGIASVWDTDTSRLTIENATLNGGALADVLNLTQVVSGKYVTSDPLSRKDTITIDATEDTLLKEYGILNSMSAADRTVKLYNSDGSLAGTITVNEASTIGDLLDFINSFDGISASIKDGIITISNGYIENTTLENSMGLDNSNKSSYALGSIMTITTTAAVTGDTTLKEIIDTLGTADKVKDGYTLRFNSKDLNVSQDTTINDLINQIHQKGGSASIDATGRLVVTGGTLDGTVASALGITSITKTEAVSSTGSTLLTTKTEYADLDTKLSEVGLTGASNIIVHDQLGNALKTINIDNTATIRDVFDKLKAEGIDGIIANGVISLDSAEYKFITGTLPTALGITTQTVTQIVNTTASSTAPVTFTGTAVADATTTINSIIAVNSANNKITVYNKDNNPIATITISTTTTLDELFKELAKHDINAQINDGLISFDSPSGNYVKGPIIDAFGMTPTTITVTTTVGKSSTSTAVVSYTVANNATINNTLAQIGINKANTITVHKSDGTTLNTVIANNTTIDGVFDILDQYGIQGVISEGIITLTSADGAYVTDASGSNLLATLGIKTESYTTTTTVGKANTSSAAVTYTNTEVATKDTLISSCIDVSSGNTLIISNRSKQPIDTITVTQTMTFDDLFEMLKLNGIEAKMVNGIITLKSDNANYVSGDVADKLGISVVKYIGVGTGGGGGTPGSTIEGGATVEEALLAQFAYFLGSTTTINIKSSDGAIIASQEFYGYAKISDLINFFTKYGIDAKLEDNILKLDNDNGIYAEDATTGGLLTQIGVGVTTKQVATNFLTVITQSSAEAAIAIGSVSTLTAGNLYSISSLSDLNKLASLVNSGQASNCTFILTGDIDMANSPGYIPIGTDEHKFMGTFYGNGHVISNVSISQSGTSGVGIFGVTGNTARILDLGVENATVSGKDYTGVIVGNSAGTITNCYVKGNVNVNGNSYVGAITGQATNTIASSYTSGNININGSGYVGGLAGYINNTVRNSFVQDVNVTSSSGKAGGFTGVFGSAASYDKISIKGTINVSGSNCIGGYVGASGISLSNLNANVTGTVKATSGYAGGIAGSITSSRTISNCNATMSITGSGGNYVGGIVGYANSATISQSSYNGTITATDTGNVGGIAGVAGTISQSSYNGTITATGTNSVGGIAGASASVITNCTASGMINASGNCRSIGGIIGFMSNNGKVTNCNSNMNINNSGPGNSIGGLIGQLYSSSIVVSKSYSTGNITAANSSYVGGLIGDIRTNGHITINSCYTTGNVTGNSNVGGFAGYIYAGNNSGDSYYQVHIETSFASGNVTGSNSTYTGGFVGYAYEVSSSDSYPMDGDIYIYTCYASGTVSSGKGFFGDSNAASMSGCVYNNANTASQRSVTGLSLTQMQDQATMTARGFTTDKGWKYESGKTPQLIITSTGKTSSTTNQSYSYYTVERPVNTNSDDLQNILDNGIAGGNADGGIAVEDDLLGNVVAFPETYLTIHIKSSDGAIIKSQGFNCYSRISELLAFLNNNGINSYMSNGILYLDNDNGLYAEDAIMGGILSQMQIGVTTKPIQTSFLTVITQSSAEAAIAIGSVSTLTAGNLYSISSLSDLNKLASLVNSGQASNCTFILTGDIDMANSPGYIPIGTDEHKFMGTFYGNGHVISNVSISQSGTSGVGIFGVTGNTARILDLGVENATVSGKDYTGVIVGNSAGTITNCYVKGNVNVNGNSYVGAITGQATNTIASSYTSGNININGSGYVGGLAGYINNTVRNSFVQDVNVTSSSGKAGGFTGVFGSAASYDKISIKGTINVSGSNCIGGYVGASGISLSNLNANVTGTVKATSGYAGGIAGSITSSRTISNCNATMSITGSGGNYVGGIVGYANSATISQSSYNGTITATDTGNVGGIAGVAGTISQSSYNGTITATGTNSVGGIAGASASVITNCTASGMINASGNCRSIGGIIGFMSNNGKVTNCNSNMNINNSGPGNSIGGLIGQLYSSSIVVSKSYSTGNITAANSSYVGGLIGDIRTNGHITINSCYTTGNVTGNSNVGGFAGYIYAGNNSGDSYYQVHIETSFASGNVTGSNSTYTGGFVGYAYEVSSSDSYPMDGDIYIYTCYASGTVSSGKGFFGDSNAASMSGCVYNNANTASQRSVTGLSLTQMQDQATMTDRGFTTDKGWKYESGKTPQLIITSTGKTSSTTNQSYSYYTVERPVNTNSIILYRNYEPGTGGSGSGGGGAVAVTILTNSTSDQQLYDTIANMTTDTLFELLGIKGADTGYITVISNGTQYIVTVKSSDTLDDIISTLAGYNVSGSVHDGKLNITGTEEGYISGMTDNVKNALKFNTGLNNTYTTVTETHYYNTNSNKQQYNSTLSLNSSTTYAQLGMSANGTITVGYEGAYYTITVKTSDTIDDTLTTLAGLGISGSIKDGKLTLTGTPNGFIQNISDNVKNALKLKAGANESYITTTKTICDNKTSGDLVSTSNNIKIDYDTKLSNINGFNNGNGNLIIHQTNGKFTTISVNASSTLSEFFTQISKYGLVGNIDSSGKVSIEGIGNVYMQAASGGSNILTALKLSNVINNVQTVTVNRTSNILSHTVKVAATGITQLGNLSDSNGKTMGAGNGTIILSTTSDAGNKLVTLTFSRTQTIYDVIDKLAEYGIQASLDALGKFTVNSSTLTDFDISGNLGELLMGTNYSKDYGTSNTYNISTNLIQTTIGPMTKDTPLAAFGITSGNILITQQGVNYTVNIDTTQIKTVADFMNLLAEYGFNSDIDAAGRLSVSGIGESYLTSITGGSNILDVFGLTDWSLGEITQTSDHLADYETIVKETTLDTKLNQLTDKNGNSLGITSGNIYVYQDGTRYLVNINNEDTLQTLAAKLSQYGITMGLDSNGKLYFDGTNNSYMTTQGISSGASNILAKLNIADNWNTRYDSISENLEYTVEVDNRIDGNTKLSELQDKDGNNLNISEGAFYVYNNGVRTTEYITADMTVNDFMALLARNGLIADISEDGSISVGAYNNTYLATSATSGANSNIVSTLFAEWDFVNIYTSNGLTIPKDVIKAVTRDTKLSDINEGTYQEGFITVVKDGIQTNIELTADDTIGTLMDQLALYGFESVLNENGQLILKNTGNSLLQKYTGTGQASNALELLGIDLNNWIQTNTYESETLNVVTTTTIDSDVTRDTLLSKLGVTTGEYYIYNNGVKYTAYISTGETMGSFLDTLKSFGIETSLVSDGDSSILTIIGSGDSYITKSNSTTNASNVVEKLFGSNNHNTSYKYEGLEQTSTLVTTFTAATEDTLLSYFNKPWGSDTLKAEGSLAIIVNGENAKIEITENETFGSLIKKFEALGLEASMTSDGQLIIQSGFDTFTIDQANTDSSIMATIGLQYHQDLGGFAASSETTKATTTQIEEKTLSVANYAGYDTKMGLLNISDGTLSIYRNGEKATIQIKKDETFGDLRSRISSAFADVELTFEDGYLKIFSKNPDDSIEVGATTDTSNFAAITGISSDGKTVSSARELYCVNSDSVIMNSGLFRRGDVTEGTFIVGDATFSISNTTTLAGLISQINSNDAANATAYWDSIDGKLVIKSRTTGSALINIEAGTSNFTDIMGYTNTTWAADGSVETTKMNVNVQDVGNNAKFSINGTYYTSNSNTITSDISRIKGLTINLKGLTEDSSVTLTVERDKETLANAVSDIVDSYNELMKNVDEAISKDGKLHDQSVLKLVRNQLRNMMTSSDAGTTVFRNLDAIGIKVENASANNISTDNITTLTFDKDKFIQAYEADEDALKALLIGSDSNTGIFTKVETLIESSLKAVTGYFATAEASYDREVKDIENKIEKQKKALDRYRAQLEAKFASMDILIANMQQQYSSFLTT
ncbi:MAG: flagellar filament capping protein FliD [Candidatus Gastranaerophilaceae bacterium]